MSSPSQELAKKIIERLASENLFTDDDAKNSLHKLAEGKMRAEDWKLALEKGMDTEASDE